VPGCEGVVVFAAAEGGWELVALPWYTPGLVARAVGDTCGLAAIPLVDVRLEDVEVGSESTLGARSPGGFVHKAMIGWSAIAVGNAEGAYDAAALYAAERYQGGRLIEAHEAVRGLLGDSFSRIEAARAHVEAMALEAPGGALALRRAFATKLRVTHACRTAVSDCLQVLGGYGYMEDYRLEKRLRDAMMLESIGMRPADLRRLCGAPGSEVAA
jgi:alkylation response protein AidB-like acyl-CoA dehydrogenase